MTIEDLIKSGAVIVHNTHDGSKFTVVFDLSAEEKACWDDFQEKLKHGVVEASGFAGGEGST